MRYTLVERGKDYYLEPKPVDALVAKVFTKDKLAYIEPCGATPDGLWFSVDYVAHLLNRDVIAPHYYGNPEQIEEVESSGIAFDIVGETESDEESRNLDAIMSIPLPTARVPRITYYE